MIEIVIKVKKLNHKELVGLFTKWKRFGAFAIKYLITDKALAKKVKEGINKYVSQYNIEANVSKIIIKGAVPMLEITAKLDIDDYEETFQNIFPMIEDNSIVKKYLDTGLTPKMVVDMLLVLPDEVKDNIVATIINDYALDMIEDIARENNVSVTLSDVSAKVY